MSTAIIIVVAVIVIYYMVQIRESTVEKNRLQDGQYPGGGYPSGQYPGDMIHTFGIHNTMQFPRSLCTNPSVSAPGNLIEAYTQDYGPSLMNRFVHTPKHIKSDREIYQDNRYSQVFGAIDAPDFPETPIIHLPLDQVTLNNSHDPAWSNPEWSDYADNTFDPNNYPTTYTYDMETRDNIENLDILYQLHQL